jgi:RNA polymerase sigma-70 factor (ECF subfamily)
MDEGVQEIIAGLRQGNRDAWMRLHELYAERLWHEVARLMGGSASDVGDVVQDSFMAAARSAKQFDSGRGTLWLWLLAIARNRVALYWRKQLPLLEQAQRWCQGLDGRASEWVSGSAQTPPEALQATELKMLIRCTLSHLPEEYQRLLCRRYLDGASSEQIADENRSTPEAVRAMLMRARQAFRKAFSKIAGCDYQDVRRSENDD